MKTITYPSGVFRNSADSINLLTGGRSVYVNLGMLLQLKAVNMVEAAGVEPASENAVSKEPTYLVTFLRRLPGTLAGRAQNGQETQPASLMISP